MSSVTQILLADNLIKEEEFRSNPEKFTELECFHFNLPEHPTFSDFSHITILRILEQDIVDLEFLKDTPYVENLFVFHTNLCDTNGLKYISRIKYLYLEGNKLKAMPDVSHFPEIEQLSIAANDLTETPVFPQLDSLKILNIACIGVSSLDSSISNLTNLESLNISGNNFSDYSFVDNILTLESLKDISINDPRFGTNPICKMPNYETIIISLLPNIETIDTFKIPNRYRTVVASRISEIELYYSVCSAAEVSALNLLQSEFINQSNDALNNIKTGSLIDSEKIYSIIDEFNYVNKSIEQFVQNSYQMSFDTGGSISFSSIDPENEIWEYLNGIITKKFDFSSAAQLSSVYEIHSKFLDDKYQKIEYSEEISFISIDKLADTPILVQTWIEKNNSFENLESVTLESNFAWYFACSKKKDMLLPRYLLIFAHPSEISDIESLCERSNVEEITPTNTEEEIILFNQPFELKPTLTVIKLVNCDIKSLSIFDGLEQLQFLSVPFNNINTMKDLPQLPSLKNLDVSFNKIETIEDLIPDLRAAGSMIQELNICGNPICSPKVLKYLPEIFRQVRPVMKTNERPIYDINDFVSGLNIDAITSIDLSDNCISSLAPLGQLVSLEKLKVSKNNLKEIDFSSSTLKYADFSLNQIKLFPKNAQFSKIETLILNCNQIVKLEPNGTLISLFVTGNQITVLPNQSMYPNLVVLHISENPINNSPSDLRILYQFPKMKMLNGVMTTVQMHNKAKSTFNGIIFEEDLQTLLEPGQTHLDLADKELRDVNVLRSETVQSLILSRNSLTNINFSVKAFPRLLQIKLANNQIQQFDFLSNLTMLRELDLCGNKLVDSHLKAICMMKFPQLQHLSLGNNTIKTIELPFLPDYFPKLEAIDLSHNYISQITNGALDIASLRTLDLGYNSLKKLDNLGIASLLSLDLSHNRVSNVDEVFKLQRCTNLIRFWFNDNPLAQRNTHKIRCLCILRSLREVDGKSVTDSDMAQVQMVIESNGGGGSTGSIPQPAIVQPGRVAKVNNVMLGNQPLPQLQATTTKRRQGESKIPGRFPR